MIPLMITIYIHHKTFFPLRHLVIKRSSGSHRHYYSGYILYNNSTKASKEDRICSGYGFTEHTLVLTIWWACNKWERIINDQPTGNTNHKRDMSINVIPSQLFHHYLWMSKCKNMETRTNVLPTFWVIHIILKRVLRIFYILIQHSSRHFKMHFG